MTESVLNSIAPTPLAEALAAKATSAGANLALRSYRGVLTPQDLDACEAEADAWTGGAAMHDLGWLRRVAVRGEDRFRWLSGMVTNAVETLPDLAGAYNLILNAQGRIQGDCHVWRSGDELDLELTVDQAEALLAHLDRFIIMDDVELLPLPGWTAIGLAGPESAAVLARLGLPAPEAELTLASGVLDMGEPSNKSGSFSIRVARAYSPTVPHFTLWTEAYAALPLWTKLAAAGARPIGAGTVETLRILEGIPAYGIDMQSRDLAQETGQMRALSFTKGCYLGQEIVERVRSRGQVHRHLRSLEIFPDDPAGEPPAPGAELQIGAKPAGTLTSVAAAHLNETKRIFAIGMIRSEAEVGKEPLRYAGGRAMILNGPIQLRVTPRGPRAAEETV